MRPPPTSCAEGLDEAEQRARHAPLERQEGRGRERVVGVAQAARQQRHDVPIDWRIVRESLERGAADEDQPRAPQRGDRGRARRAVDHRQLADHGAGPENRKDALAARGRDHADLEQALVDPIAAVPASPARNSVWSAASVRPRPLANRPCRLRRQAGKDVLGACGGFAHSRLVAWLDRQIGGHPRRAASDKESARGCAVGQPHAMKARPGHGGPGG